MPVGSLAYTSSYRARPGKIASPAASADVHVSGRRLFVFMSKNAPEPAYHWPCAVSYHTFHSS